MVGVTGYQTMPLVIACSVSGMPAAVRRIASAVHVSGTYNSKVNGHVRPSAISALDTATWQLPILPSAPQYWRCTPTECTPFFKSPVSSTTSTASESANASAT